ncbi:MAG TPA: CoA pyrophosphatase [Gemmatimonadales bacterium]|nr:CoA pyrophosphatase [Gemmatimonadales bacterium]
MTSLDHIRRVLASRPGVADHDPAARPAAVAVILHEDSGPGISALFIKRAEQAGDPWSGQIAFPGGRFEEGDGDLLSTAIREAREETGIDLTQAEALGPLDDVNPRSPHLPPIVVRPFVFAVSHRTPHTNSPAEVQRTFWIPFKTLIDPATSTQVTMTFRSVPRTFTAYKVDGEIIWGMTERIVRLFLERITA